MPTPLSGGPGRLEATPAGSRPFTALSQTSGQTSDAGVPTGQSKNPHVRERTPPDSPDTRHETTDLKVVPDPCPMRQFTRVMTVTLGQHSAGHDLAWRMWAKSRRRPDKEAIGPAV
jgi:hypothetical protein